MHARSTHHRFRCPARPGSAYLLVLGATLIVTTMAVGGAMVLSTEVSAQGKHAQMVQATLSAQSALEAAAEVFVNQPPERKALANGASVVAATIGGLACVVNATATDGSAIGTDIKDPFTLVAYAEGSVSSQGVKIDVVPVGRTVTAMDAALYAGGTLGIDGTVLTGGPAIGAHGNVTATSSIVLPPVSSTSGLVVGSNYYGKNTIVDERVMPSPLGMAYYADLAQPISYAATGGKIRRCIIAPGVNPFGTASARGIYSVNCGGGTLDIEDCRISGTLIIWNAKALRVGKQVLWEPASNDLPMLLVRGDISFEFVAGNLSEASASTNLNPASLPFQGASDGDMTDQYPCALRGVIYVQGNVGITGPFSLAGSIVSTGNITIKTATCSLPRPTDLVTPPGLVPYVLNASSGTIRMTR